MTFPTFEDKVLQRAVAMVLEAVYEQSFLDCSYGFRPGRSARQALVVVQHQAVKMGGRWVLEVDIRKFYDSPDHRHLQQIVRKRVRDGVLLQLIGKWLNAGVMEDGVITCPDSGSPQGGVVSPILANIYLHEVLDEWFAAQVVPRLVGRAVLVRYADDLVIIFESERDARRVYDVLAEAIGEVRPDASPREDQTGRFPATRPEALVLARRRWRQAPVRHLRPTGIHALLGHVPQGALGREAEDGQRSLPARSPAHHGLGSGSPTRPGPGAVGSARAEVAWALRVLWRHREHASAQHLPLPNPLCVVEVVEPPFAEGSAVVGRHEASSWSATRSRRRASVASRHVANPCPEEPDARIVHVRIRGSLGDNPPRRPDVYPARAWIGGGSPLGSWSQRPT